jgi:transcriptional regulator with XRE-family HTH domain
MKIHTNASLTPKQRQTVKDLYATGQYTQEQLASQFNVTRKTISKWLSRATVLDAVSPRKSVISRITPEFEADVKSYRENLLTSHHGKVRIAFELSGKHTCSNPSNVYTVLKRLQLNKAKLVKVQVAQKLPVGKHRTQMDIQTLPAIKGSEGYEYKISIIHLSTRIKYSEIHDNFESKTIAQVYERSLENLPPFL